MRMETLLPEGLQTCWSSIETGPWSGWTSAWSVVQMVDVADGEDVVHAEKRTAIKGVAGETAHNERACDELQTTSYFLT